MKHLIGKVVIFQQKILELECYAEPNMRARIIAINTDGLTSENHDEHIWKITFDYSEYETFNAFLESADYYDDHGIPNKTAREVGQYKPQDNMWFGSPELYPFEDFFIVSGDRSTKVIEKFKKSGHVDYIEWLEEQVEI